MVNKCLNDYGLEFVSFYCRPLLGFDKIQVGFFTVYSDSTQKTV